jgi:DNA polymerase-3 subunit beta
MKIKVKSNLLSEAFKKISSVVDQKISRPILVNCLLKAEGQQIELQATDLEVSVKVIIEADIEKPGSICVNTKNFFEILKELPADDLYLEVTNQNLLKIKCQNFDFSLMITHADEYPRLNFNTNSEPFELDSNEIMLMINKTIHAVSTDETRIFLTGIFLQVLNQKLRAVAIDGHRMALFDLKQIEKYPAPLKEGVIIPKKGINELRKMAETSQDKKIKIAIDDSFIYVSLGHQYLLNIRLISREYPKYQSVIPQKTQSHFVINRDSLLTTVKGIKPMSNDKTNGIKMKISNNQLILNTKSVNGEATAPIPIEYSGKDMEIGFNVKYLIDTLQVLPQGPVQFDFNNDLSPTVIKSNNDAQFLGVIMPLKI